MCDLEMPEAYREKVRKAKKDHICSDCRGIIKCGETYNYISGIWDHTPASYKRCMDCEHLRCEINDDSPYNDSCDGIALGHLYSYLLESNYNKLFYKWSCAFNAYAEHRGSKLKIDLDEIGTWLTNHSEHL